MKSTAGLPFLLDVGMQVAFVPPRLDSPREGRVSAIEDIDEYSAVITFDTVSDKSTAEELLGSHCLIELSDDDYQELLELPQSWEGWEVVDDRYGFLGIVTALVENSAQALLEVSAQEGAQSGLPLLIPVVDEFIVSVDIDEHMVRTRIPAGLLDL